MRVLAIETELMPMNAQRDAAVLRDEAAHVRALQKRDLIRDIWFTRRGRRAVVMLECADEDEAVRLLNDLPLVHSGFIRFDVHALQPYDGFDRLLAASPHDQSILNHAL